MRSSIVFLTLLLFSGAAAAEEDLVTSTVMRHDANARYHYEQGEYQEALTNLQAAQALQPSMTRLYNIALCHDNLERARAALDHYERFVEEAERAGIEDDVHLGDAYARIAVLDGQIASAQLTRNPYSPRATPAPSWNMRYENVPRTTVQATEQRTERLHTSSIALTTITAAFAVLSLGTTIAVVAWDAEQWNNSHEIAMHQSLEYTSYALWALTGASGIAALVTYLLYRRERARAIQMAVSTQGLTLNGHF